LYGGNPTNSIGNNKFNLILERMSLDDIKSYLKIRQKMYTAVIPSIENGGPINIDRESLSKYNRLILDILIWEIKSTKVETVREIGDIVEDKEIYIKALSSIIKDLLCMRVRENGGAVSVYYYTQSIYNTTTNKDKSIFDTINQITRNCEQDRQTLINTDKNKFQKAFFSNNILKPESESESIQQYFNSSYKVNNIDMYYSREPLLDFNCPNNTLIYLLELHIMNIYIMNVRTLNTDPTNINFNKFSSLTDLDFAASYSIMIKTQYGSIMDNTESSTFDENCSKILGMMELILDAVFGLCNKYINMEDVSVLTKLSYIDKIIIASNIITYRSSDIILNPDEWLNKDPLNMILLRIINLLMTSNSVLPKIYENNENNKIIKSITTNLYNKTEIITYIKTLNTQFPSYLDVKNNQMPDFSKWHYLYSYYNILKTPESIDYKMGFIDNLKFGDSVVNTNIDTTINNFRNYQSARTISYLKDLKYEGVLSTENIKSVLKLAMIFELILIKRYMDLFSEFIENVDA
jgi:hypothetical protein